MRSRVFYSLLLALCAAILAAIYLLVRPASEHVTPTATQDEIRAELIELGTKTRSTPFRVKLRRLGGEVTWYQDGRGRLRLDLRDYGPDGKRRERTFIENGSARVSCREPGICEQGTELFDYGSDQNELEALGSVLLLPFQSVGGGAAEGNSREAGAPAGPLFSRRSEQIAGVSGACFTTGEAEGSAMEICFDDRGAPLRLAFIYPEPGMVGLKYEAVEVDHSVAEADFEPPYPPGP